MVSSIECHEVSQVALILLKLHREGVRWRKRTLLSGSTEIILGFQSDNSPAQSKDERVECYIFSRSSPQAKANGWKRRRIYGIRGGGLRRRCWRPALLQGATPRPNRWQQRNGEARGGKDASNGRENEIIARKGGDRNRAKIKWLHVFIISKLITSAFYPAHDAQYSPHVQPQHCRPAAIRRGPSQTLNLIRSRLNSNQNLIDFYSSMSSIVVLASKILIDSDRNPIKIWVKFDRTLSLAWPPPNCAWNLAELRLESDLISAICVAPTGDKNLSEFQSNSIRISSRFDGSNTFRVQELNYNFNHHRHRINQPPIHYYHPRHVQLRTNSSGRKSFLFIIYKMIERTHFKNYVKGAQPNGPRSGPVHQNLAV